MDVLACALRRLEGARVGGLFGAPGDFDEDEFFGLGRLDERATTATSYPCAVGSMVAAASEQQDVPTPINLKLEGAVTTASVE
eukprot:1820922-Pyramimonas_sp.AAC.1